MFSASQARRSAQTALYRLLDALGLGVDVVGPALQLPVRVLLGDGLDGLLGTDGIAAVHHRDPVAAEQPVGLGR